MSNWRRVIEQNEAAVSASTNRSGGPSGLARLSKLNARYRAKRTDSLPDAADVEMAVFGLSFEVWAANTKIRDTVRETYGKALRSNLQTLDKQL
jgi:hypothetical protein